MDNNELNKSRKRGKYLKDEPDRGKNTVLMYLHDFVYWLTAILLIFLLLFRAVVVSGPSMNDTLVHGDYLLLLNNVFYTNFRQGDVVVASKQSYKDGEPIIKRVIATEGQWVDIDFDAGVVYVNGTALDEPYTKTPTNMYEGIEFPLLVEEGCIFLMGDNRNESKDSRSEEIGQVDRREILGKVILLIIPGLDPDTETRNFSRIGVLSNGK